MSIGPQTPGWMPQSWADEIALIKLAAEQHGIQWEMVGAVRKAENGQHSDTAFGVLSLPLPQRDSYAKQLDVCCNSLADQLVAYDEDDAALATYTTPHQRKRLVYTAGFIEFFQQRWAPAGAGNDPHDLNAKWTMNVTAWYYRLINEENT